ncbi:hypothetical protein KM043_017089 [Ampulex compressa]|nr:hypothetical protein KM043_017089 [Ampulex compressa]
MVEKVKESVMKYKTKRKAWKIGTKIWYSVEWKVRKRKLRRELRELRKGRIRREEYVKKRREYGEWCKGERQRYEKKEEDKIKSIKTEKEVWKYIDKYRKKKEGIDESIQSERWRRHFMDLLDGTSEKVILEEKEETEEGEEMGQHRGEEKRK